jgi:hypothetical protein
MTSGWSEILHLYIIHFWKSGIEIIPQAIITNLSAFLFERCEEGYQITKCFLPTFARKRAVFHIWRRRGAPLLPYAIVHLCPHTVTHFCPCKSPHSAFIRRTITGFHSRKIAASSMITNPTIRRALFFIL